MKIANREAITKRYRRVSWGRLYWKTRNWHMRNRFDSDDVCITHNGTLTIHYKSIDGLLRDIEYAERVLGKVQPGEGVTKR